MEIKVFHINAFQKEIPDYAKTELRALKKIKSSDELMIEAL